MVAAAVSGGFALVLDGCKTRAEASEDVAELMPVGHQYTKAPMSVATSLAALRGARGIPASSYPTSANLCLLSPAPRSYKAYARKAQSH